MKKVLPILMALFFVLPVASVFAATIGQTLNTPESGWTRFDNQHNLILGSGSSGIRDYAWNKTLGNSQDIKFSFNGTKLRLMAQKGLSPPHSSNVQVYIDGVKVGPAFSTKSATEIHQILVFEKIGLSQSTHTVNILTEDGIGFRFDSLDIDGVLVPFVLNTYKPINSIFETHSFNTVDLSWKNPVASDIQSIIVKSNGIEVANLANTAEAYSFINLNPETLYNLEVIVKYTDGESSEPVSIKVTTDAAPEVTNLKANAGLDEAKISWSNPIGSDFAGVTILKDGVKVVDLEKTINNYTLTNLLAEKEYTYEVVARYTGGFKSTPSPVTFTTLKAPDPVGDVSKLKADVDYNRVDLSWTLPTSENFKHVNIYRDTLDKSLLDKLLGVRTVKAATPIFETNGTYFNDLTVQSETKYEYLLTTTSEEGLESDGVSTTVTTPKKPEPEIEGGGYEKDPETGDFTYTWTKPTTGKVKVMIDGKLHATVEGSTGKIIIPAADMEYTLFGKPDVQLIPVDEDGEEGKPVKPPSGGGSESGGGDAVEMPFSALELLKTTFDFIKIIGPFILLFLIIYLTPQIIKVIRMAILRRGIGGKGNDE